MNLKRILKKAGRLAPCLGMFGFPLFYAQALLKRVFSVSGPFLLWPAKSKYPLLCRTGTSDWSVFEEIFVENEYKGLGNISACEFIVDCGANVGYSSAYFLTAAPKSYVVAIEPDRGNFAQLKKNLALHASRVTALNLGVWSHAASLNFCQKPYRSGGGWAVQVEEASAGEPCEVKGVDIDTILTAFGRDHIDLLKVDIEGAEAVVFRGKPTWLDRVRVLVIEVHDDSHFGPVSDFLIPMLRERFEISRSGGLTVAIARPQTR